MLRCLKNNSGVITGTATDLGQSGTDPQSGFTWCSWNIAEDALPNFIIPSGAPDRPFMYKENGTADGIEVRTDAEVLASPNG